MVSIFTQMPISGRFRSTSIRFPTHIETMRPQNSAGSSLMTFGPGVIPWMMKAPTISAITGCAGRPRVSSGMNEVWAAALLADSGAATPSMAPCPNVSGLLGDALLDGVRGERRQDVAAAGQDAERRAERGAAQDRGDDAAESSRVSHRFLTVLISTERVSSSSRLRRISATPNMPTATETKLMPEYSSRAPKVKRGVPV